MIDICLKHICFLCLDKIKSYFQNVQDGPLHKEIQRLYESPGSKVGYFFLLINM